MPLQRTTAQRLWPRLSPPNEVDCREWQGYRDALGYGSIGIGRKTERVHRVAWLLTYGPIPDGLCVLHRCDNPPCCEPTHLFLGTRADNNADKVAKGRATLPVPQSGEQNPQAKLTTEQVVSIRERYATGAVYQRALALEFGVERTLISMIVSGRIWTEVGGPRVNGRRVRQQRERSR